jgi:Cft2 family RNA processing exonuclease
MNVLFLGGASGIGASCTLIQLGDQWVLVDAGVRMDAGADRLPDLAALQGKPLAAIFVTHAHADHIGALPLVHQAFPTVPIYASRATMLIMEVMLNDALQVMAKRASTEFEVPLYDETLVASTLHRLHPLPLSGTTTIAELPNVTIHTSRAGHVAGAISLGFEAPDGRLLISGDVSVTPQHTVPGAQLSTLRHPDLFILESTYGARMHPNRQTEEDRLAQTVSEAIERGGHVLIPAFALGRAQEILRILHMAQRRGRIPEFPVWVDGLVRKVCATYTAIPSALTPALQRQIQKGYPPFFSGMVRSVTDVRHRERLVQGNPACIVSSSGMLTGGPSAYYATQIAGHTDASILITGYQDDESPGRRLLELADQQNGTRTLELGEHSVAVRCRFDRYHLSAHADGNELTAMVSALRPRKVALVHGDPESRAALAQRMERFTEVILPTDGTVLEVVSKGKKSSGQRQQSKGAQRRAPTEHKPLAGHLPDLWRMVADGSGMQVMSVRELALAWYGFDAGEAEEAEVQQELQRACQAQQGAELYFIPVPDLEGMYRVRAAEGDELPTQPQAQAVQPGMVLLLLVYGEKVLPGVCFDARADAVWVYMPASEGSRTRFPRTAVLEVVGPWEAYPITDISETRQTMADIVKAAQRWQRQHSARTLVERLEEGVSYRFDEVAVLVEVEPDDLVGRLGLVLMLNDTPRLFERQHPGTGATAATIARGTRYQLRAGWQTALAEGAGDVRPDQMWILSVIEQHLGNPPDLYRRSVNPDTGEVTLAFHFPDVARQHYAAALAAASEEVGVTITIAPQPHQGALSDMAHSVLPAGLTVTKTSLHHDRDTIRLRCSGQTSSEEREAAVQRFAEQTGWTLEIELEHQSQTGGGGATRTKPTARPGQGHGKRLDVHTAMAMVKGSLRDEAGLYKVSANQAEGTLVARFHFPDVAGERYTDVFAHLAEQTGWYVTVYPEPHQGAMESLARRLVPAGVEVVGAPSLYRKNRQVIVKVRGKIAEEDARAARDAFVQTTGWTLDIHEG